MTTPEVVFWVTREYGICRWNDALGELPGNTNSGVCAFQEDIQKIFSCPAGDAICWAWRDVCLNTRDGVLIPGEGQILCQNPYESDPSYRAWCCSQETRCPTSASSINICLGAWLNPLANLDAVEVSSFAQSVLGTTTMGTSTVHTNAPIFSTTTASQLSQSSPAVASLSASSAVAVDSSSLTDASFATGSSSVSSTISTSTPGSSGTAQTEADVPHRPLSGGAIAGIIVGIVVVLVAIVTGLLLRRRRRRHQSAPDVSTVETPQHAYHERLPGQTSSHASHSRPLGVTETSQSMSVHDGRVPYKTPQVTSSMPSGVTGAP